MSLAARHVEQPCITHARSEQSLERCWHSTLEKISYSSWNNTSREEKKDPVLWFYQTLPIPASTSKQWFPVVGKHSWLLRIPIPLACRYRRRPIANFVRFLNIQNKKNPYHLKKELCRLLKCLSLQRVSNISIFFFPGSVGIGTQLRRNLEHILSFIKQLQLLLYE